MLLVHPVHELLRQLPLLVGAIVLGRATGNPLWSLLGVAIIVALGVARWFTTTYRIDEDEVRLRTGVLQRSAVALPRNRIRSVQTEARLLHRLLGLMVLRVGTGQQAVGERVFELDAVPTEEVPRLRAILLAYAAPGRAGGRADTGTGTGTDTGTDTDSGAARVTVLARWQPAWLRYSPLSLSGLVMIGAAVGLLYQAGFGAAVQESAAVESGLAAARSFGPVVAAIIGVTVVVLASVVLAVGRSLLTYGNLVLERRRSPGDTLHLRHGLLRITERTFDMSRLRGGSLREPLVVRWFGGARLDAIMTGVHGAGESSLLLPPCPGPTARGVLTELVGDGDVVGGALRSHGRAAARRRFVRALAPPAALLVVLVAGQAVWHPPLWVWGLWAVLTAGSVALAADRVRALGHRVDADWLVARQGSAERRRDCVATAGIVGWTVRQSWFQRRAGVATLVAATAAGTKRYEVLDIPAELAWTVAARASPWVADSMWARM
ncbi:PH domain-containing protein [Mycolicibacterium palauense]|uniref:PH domain-containing protein n=1 Tax=Mycolicibacterium palauense TaxID=2034511 RepID=UPI000BFEE6CB|nr:PH domain-containing protein [Mycolicibacterium palauense]